jgi:hypothetical protein
LTADGGDASSNKKRVKKSKKERRLDAKKQKADRVSTSVPVKKSKPLKKK